MRIAFWLTGLAQVGLLAMQYPAGTQLLVGAVLCAAVISLLWQVRRVLPPHGDMILIMTAFGGFGMVLGGYGQPTCHHSWGGTVGMLVASLPPSLRFARCLQVPGGYALLALDTVGMLVGMACGHRLAMAADPWVMHGAMLLGMNLGMTLHFVVPIERFGAPKTHIPPADPGTTTPPRSFSSPPSIVAPTRYKESLAKPNTRCQSSVTSTILPPTADALPRSSTGSSSALLPPVGPLFG
ncbi:MAG: hypothetical protein ACK58M_07875 [Acidobacteriota bacterium]